MAIKTEEEYNQKNLELETLMNQAHDDCETLVHMMDLLIELDEWEAAHPFHAVETDSLKGGVYE